jgi:hypothetical protein
VRNDRAEVRYSKVQYKLNRDQTQTKTFLKGSVLHGQASAQSSQATALQPLAWASAQGEFRVGWVLTLQSQPIQRPRV